MMLELEGEVGKRKRGEGRRTAAGRRTLRRRRGRRSRERQERSSSLDCIVLEADVHGQPEDDGKRHNVLEGGLGRVTKALARKPQGRGCKISESTLFLSRYFQVQK